MIALPLVAPAGRTAAERAARAKALRVALGPPSGWSAEAREALEERVAVLAADGVEDAERAGEEIVRAALLRRVP